MTKCWFVTNRPADADGNITDELPPPSALADLRTGRIDLKTRKVIPFRNLSPITYDGLDLSDDPKKEPGTRRLFLELYHNMVGYQGKKKKRVPGGDTLVFIHGFNVTWESSINTAARLAEVYGSKTKTGIRNILLFAWPSQGKLFRPYRDDKLMAQGAGDALGRTMAKFLDFYQHVFEEQGLLGCGQRIHLMAHSMGNRVLEYALRALNQDERRFGLLSEVLMMNADCDYTSMNPDRELHVLPRLCRRVTIFHNKSDDALQTARRFNKGVQRLGERGPKNKSVIEPTTLLINAASELRNADKSDALKGNPERMIEIVEPGVIDAIPPADNKAMRLAERLFDHWGYTHRDEVIREARRILRGKEPEHFESEYLGE